MPSRNRDRLTAAIQAVLAEGLPQDEKVLHAVAATHGDASPESIAGVLSQRDSADAATLAAMLLFPDDGVRMRLEPLALLADCTPQQALEVAQEVARHTREALILLPDGVRMTLPLESGDAATFVERLRLADTPPPTLANVLEQRFNPAQAVRLSVQLRTCRLRWTEARTQIVARLLHGLGDAGPRDSDCESCGQNPTEVLSWAVSWLDSLSKTALPGEESQSTRTAGPGLAELLGAKHLELSTQLRRAVEFNRVFSQSSFEVMMSQGVRAPLMHPDAIRRELALLDRVCVILTGSPAWTLTGLTEVDLGAVDLEIDREGEAMIGALGGTRAPQGKKQN